MTKKNIEHVVNYLENHTWKETAERFKISEMTISRYIKRFNQVDIINNEHYINLLKKGFNRLLRKKIYDMKAVELKLVWYLLSNKSQSCSKDQYIIKIKKMAGLVKWQKI